MGSRSAGSAGVSRSSRTRTDTIPLSNKLGTHATVKASIGQSRPDSAFKLKIFKHLTLFSLRPEAEWASGVMFQGLRVSGVVFRGFRVSGEVRGDLPTHGGLMGSRSAERAAASRNSRTLGLRV